MLRVFAGRALAAAIPIAAAGCYVVPINPDGYPAYPAVAVAPAPPVATLPATLQARLYPANDMATQTGMLAGTVTNLMNGKGRFQLQYEGELLVGEATRVSDDERSGIASAYGQSGTYMSCAYRMATPRQGTGTCTLSNGARYQVHLGG